MPDTVDNPSPHPSVVKPASTPAHRWRRRRKRQLGLVLALLIVLLLADLALSTYWTRDGINQATRAAGSLASGTLLSSPASLGRLQRELAASHASLVRARLLLVPWTPFLGHLGWIPHAGRFLVSTPPLLHSAACLTGAAASAVSVAAAVDQLAREPNVTNLPSNLVAALDAERPTIADARANMTCAVAARKTVDPRMGDGSASFVGALAQLDRSLAESNELLDALTALPNASRWLLGFDQPRRYLILGQDPFELRATGGFIGSMGLVTVTAGTITSLDYRGVLDFEPAHQLGLEPPQPLAKYMALGGWYLRDANWSPDFPTAAQQVETFFRYDQGVPADGVIALDLYAVQSLLAATGPVTLPAYGETVSADTVIDEIWQHINASGSLTSAREQDKSDYLTALVTAVLATLQQPGADSLPRLLQAATAAIMERHLLLYGEDKDAQSLVHLAGADGSVWDGPGDGLQIVDTHVSYGKMAAMVDEAVALDVTIGSNGRVAEDTLTVTYQNRYGQRAATRVWRELHSELYDFHTHTMQPGTGVLATYVRVLVPPGSALLAAEGGDDQPGDAADAGRTELSSYLVVRPDQSRSLLFRYMPAVTGAPAGTYRLTVQKQPGTVAEPLTVRVHLDAHLGPVILHSGWVRQGTTTWQYSGDLRQDQHLSLQWALP